MNATPPAVRILPMDSREEFPEWTIEKLQLDFFLDDLPFRSDGYLYRKSGLRAEPGTVVLFQFCGAIVASAVLRDVERFETPREKVYEGALYFDPRSIRVFDPVRENVIARIWPKVKRLGRVKWTLDPKRYADFERELKHIEIAKP
jgi:hypothetical protein